MKLTGKQKRYLRASANRMKPIFEIGKNGLSTVWLAEILKAIDARELIKISILQNAAVNPDDVQQFIEANSDITVVQKLGKTLVLFKVSSNKDNRDLSNEVFSI
ncbi:YhbY family RNA-binding protein [Lentilactobacillus farraginis]|uniref:RNA-binding protein n=1 Tax=Lentilactobacillus farraginis DSM 18382 = JCM 14108 TaxID=1423743 RepID=X0PHQ0_9LACO|nr:YhbY family RNA-binding protein [Lentilactobacillus farraginis]KRM04309.1 RNA-binding protein [Lentilactobacillus farraginis DSM 18382 = JCM 14108]GAF35986.1 RNA binding protein [Lentilactobacillus farraginis DSM 18382 = JCM 14108]